MRNWCNIYMWKNDFPHPAFPREWINDTLWYWQQILYWLIWPFMNYILCIMYIFLHHVHRFNIQILRFNSSSGIAIDPPLCLWYSSCNTTASCAGSSLCNLFWKASISSSSTSSFSYWEKGSPVLLIISQRFTKALSTMSL